MKERLVQGGDIERQVLIGIIVNDTVLGRIAGRWNENLFQSPYSNIIGSWCVRHYKKYAKAPNRDIEKIFKRWAEANQGNANVQLIESLLTHLSHEKTYEWEKENNNPEFLIHMAEDYFDTVALRRMAEGVLGHLDDGKLDRARERANKYRKVEMGRGKGIDLFIDKEAVFSTFDKQIADPLITFSSHGLNEFFQFALCRDAFIAFFGPDKSGKSFWLSEIAWQGMVQRKRVAYFTIGDMSEQQVKERFMIRVSKKPAKSLEWPLKLKLPLSMKWNKGEPCAELETKEKSFSKPLDRETAWAACEEVMQTQVKSKRSYFKMLYSESNEIDVAGIQSQLDEWELGEWRPDIIVIDYADLIMVSNKTQDRRDQINDTWMALRAMSQRQKCLLVTATQSDANAYSSVILDRKNFSEDKRKLAHPTGVVGINVTGAEKENGVCRLNWIVARGFEYHVKRCCHVAGCLGLANPAIQSIYPRESFYIKQQKGEEE